jgi:hypothetical protein
LDAANTNYGHAHRSHLYCSKDCAEKPAAPTVSGDGDEAVVREIVAERKRSGETGDYLLIMVATQCLERGRALGARDAFEAAIEEARGLAASKDKILLRWETKNYGGAAKDGLIGAVVMSEEICTAIARRSGGQGK